MRATQPVTSSKAGKYFSVRNSLRSSIPFNLQNDKIDRPTLPTMNARYYSPANWLNEDQDVLRQDDFDLLESDSFLANTEDYFTCALCVIKRQYRSPHSLEQHLTSKEHQKNFDRLKEVILRRVPCRGSIQILAIRELVINMIQSQELTDHSIDIRKSALDDFQQFIYDFAPDCSFRLSGSFLMGTATLNSELDLELIHPNSEMCDSTSKDAHRIDPATELNDYIRNCDLRPNAVETLYNIGNFISSNHDSKTGVFMVLSSIKDLNRGTPHIVVMHKPTQIKLDISCYCGSRHKIAEFIKLYLNLDERARSLAFLIKIWTKICRIDNPEAGSLPPIAFMVLVVYYLQRTSPPILPCVHESIFKAHQYNSAKDTYTSQIQNMPASETSKNFDAEQSPKNEGNGFNNNSEEEVEILELGNINDNEDDKCSELSEEDFLGLQWSSENEDQIEELFIGFFRFMIDELNPEHSQPITIRSLSQEIESQRDRSYNYLRSIEHPLKPKTNITNSLRSNVTAKYITKCFEHTFHYLTSIPLDMNLKPKCQKNPDPRTFTILYTKKWQMLSYLQMIAESDRFNKNFNSVKEMIEQDLFERDVEVIARLIDEFQKNSLYKSNIPVFIAKNFNLDMFKPDGFLKIEYCRLCKKNGHPRKSCPEDKVITLAETILNYNFELDNKVNLDRAFMHEFGTNTIGDLRRKECFRVLKRLSQLINAQSNLNCHLELYGSTVNSLGTNSSDLDICLTLKDHPTEDGLDCPEILNSISEILKDCPDVTRIETIFLARVPIIKFIFLGFSIDLSMYNQCAIYNSKLLKTYSQIDERFAPLVFNVRKFVKTYGIADASQGTLSSYAWCLLVIYFLQNIDPPLLPVLQEESKGKLAMIEAVCGWNVWFKSASDVEMTIRNRSSLTTLIKQFFLFYSNFDFTQYVICIRKSSRITKFRKDWSNCTMAIEDPFILTHNLARQLDEAMAIYIMNSFATIYSHIVKMQTLIEQRVCSINFMFKARMWNRYTITPTKPPYRGCHMCHKIGHSVKACPEANFTKNTKQPGPKVTKAD